MWPGSWELPRQQREELVELFRKWTAERAAEFSFLLIEERQKKLDEWRAERQKTEETRAPTRAQAAHTGATKKVQGDGGQEG